MKPDAMHTPAIDAIADFEATRLDLEHVPCLTGREARLVAAASL